MSFGLDYARLYQAKHANKDYVGECDVVERIISDHRFDPRVSILDIGCGLGSHSFELARRGHSVTGIDKSDSMIELAQSNKPTGLDLRFAVADITKLRLDREFDVAIMMFAVLSYMATNSDLVSCLASVRRHLRPGGILLADFWYGPGVLTDPPQEQETNMLIDGVLTTSRVYPQVLYERNVCSLEYAVTRSGSSDLYTEVHEVRYFFVPELELALKTAQLELLGTFENEAWARPLIGPRWGGALIARTQLNPPL